MYYTEQAAQYVLPLYPGGDHHSLLSRSVMFLAGAFSLFHFACTSYSSVRREAGEIYKAIIY